ncbi:LysR family transcriptional regulator [Halomonas sp. DP5Y7-2]|uniref:LysR family transcriptional regulator n=1 Tax=Halomonas sp. DP5Y7-2 TaxID=2859076 RepID=UPI001C9A19E0|nr:LysR family transcriptional regulator [Halomonas sp. DP5Y7-2]MBY5982746.1 LysR family transcriptional regulator [Halomonas sp. DP5Y7-2]
MELRTLKTFVSVATHRSFSAAARELHTVQPAISRQIADLEAELNVSLLWRNTREVRVTAPGEALLEEAQARKRVAMAASGQTGTLRIGYMSSACASFVPGLMRDFAATHPEVSLTLNEMSAQQQLDAFGRDEIDIGLSRPLPVEHRNALATLPVYEDRLMVVVPEGHRLAHRKRLALSELEQEDFVLFQRKHATGLFDQIISACGDAGFSPRIQRQPALMQTLLSEVAAGVGIAIAPGCIRRLQCDGCRFIPLRPALGAVPLELHYPTTPGRPVIDAFVALVEERLPAIRQQMA